MLNASPSGMFIFNYSCLVQLYVLQESHCARCQGCYHGHQSVFHLRSRGLKHGELQRSFHYTPAQRSWRGILDSPCPSLRPSVCRRHGFRSISQVCFGISISNFICMLMVAIGSSLLIFSNVTFKMAAWQPYWIFWFPNSNFTLAFNINFKLQRHNTYVYG